MPVLTLLTVTLALLVLLLIAPDHNHKKPW